MMCGHLGCSSDEAMKQREIEYDGTTWTVNDFPGDSDTILNFRGADGRVRSVWAAEAVDDTTPNYVFIKYLKLATVLDGH